MASTRAEVRRSVFRLLGAIGVDSPPIPVERVAEHLGACVRSVPLAGKEALSGLLYRAEGETIIGVNKEHPETRRRFTIAHEIGHLVLHDRHPLHIDRDFPVRLRDARSSQAVDPDEIAANAFAAELLMPTAMVLGDLEGQSVDYEDEQAIRHLADRYKVSLQAMIFRLVNLGLLDQAPDFGA